MASAARLVLATSSEASSTVRSWSWLMTDITMFIITCRRRSLRRSNSCSCCSLLSCGLTSSLRSDSPIDSSKETVALRGCLKSRSVTFRYNLDVRPYPTVALGRGGRHHTPKRHDFSRETESLRRRELPFVSNLLEAPWQRQQTIMKS